MDEVHVNVADAKKSFSELLARVAFGGETIVITRRGKPMARLIPPAAGTEADHPAHVRGWLDDEDPFLAAIDEIVAERSSHVPRVARSRRRGSRRA